MIYMINMHQYTHHIQLPVVLYWETQSFGISPARLDASIMLINILQGAGLKHRRKPNATSMYIRLVHITCPTEYTWNWGELTPITIPRVKHHVTVYMQMLHMYILIR